MVAKPENEPDVAISTTVERLYDTYPYPPETLIDEAPMGYNWRWHYPSAHAFSTGYAPLPRRPTDPRLRILDAGCGTGESTSYLVHMNPDADVVAIDLSNGALDVAKERLQRSVPDGLDRCSFQHKSIFDVADVPGEFDLINCVGVIHHTPDPTRALCELAAKLRPGGLIHIFVYGIHGRWEISLMQKALRLLQSKTPDAFESGVSLGRRVFAALPEDNRLRKREDDRWAQENKKDATFADMYLHPQEVDYDIPSLFRLIKDSGLDFVGFSNPRTWDLSRILSADDDLLKMAEALPDFERYRLIELLDPESITHFEFFLSKPPLARIGWSDDAALASANVAISVCVTGWPSTVLLDRDYSPVMLSESEHAFLSNVVEGSANGTVKVGAAMENIDISSDAVRQLVTKGVVLLSPFES